MPSNRHLGLWVFNGVLWLKSENMYKQQTKDGVSPKEEVLICNNARFYFYIIY